MRCVTLGHGLAGPVVGHRFYGCMSAVLEQLPIAAAVTDMKAPGLPVTFCNNAMVSLTGYPKEFTQGRNCRFLQGKKTEAAAVRAMVNGIRGAKVTTVRVTNYKKDGTAFVNVLSLIPVKDSTGEYRYNVGVLSNEAFASRDGAALEQLRKAIPQQFDATNQPKAFDEGLKVVSAEAQRKQWKSSMAKFTRLLWSVDWEGSLRQLVRMPAGQQFFGQWLTQHAPSDAVQLELVVVVDQLAMAPPEQAAEQAVQVCQRYLGMPLSTSGQEAMEALSRQSEQALIALASDSFPKFVQSKACLGLVEQLLGNSADEVQKMDGLLWDQYKVPSDCAGWLYSFVSVAASLPACIVISDMSIPGNPMFFVNDEFCRTTQYAKHEAQGRNCRFLQGPRTEPQSVAVIQDTLRRGVDCHVKITNYRKSGETFENLLTMRPVHDSNGVYRFCIGVQFEVTRDMHLKSRLAKLDKLIKLLPATLEVSSTATGAKHERSEADNEKSTALETKLQSALSGSTVGPEITGVLQEPGYFEENHATMVADIKSGAAPETLRANGVP